MCSQLLERVWRKYCCWRFSCFVFNLSPVVSSVRCLHCWLKLLLRSSVSVVFWSLHCEHLLSPHTPGHNVTSDNILSVTVILIWFECLSVNLGLRDAGNSWSIRVLAARSEVGGWRWSVREDGSAPLLQWSQSRVWCEEGQSETGEGERQEELFPAPWPQLWSRAWYSPGQSLITRSRPRVTSEHCFTSNELS